MFGASINLSQSFVTLAVTENTQNVPHAAAEHENSAEIPLMDVLETQPLIHPYAVNHNNRKKGQNIVSNFGVINYVFK